LLAGVLSWKPVLDEERAKAVQIHGSNSDKEQWWWLAMVDRMASKSGRVERASRGVRK
jgi:hypothetical protein